MKYCSHLLRQFVSSASSRWSKDIPRASGSLVIDNFFSRMRENADMGMPSAVETIHSGAKCKEAWRNSGSFTDFGLLTCSMGLVELMVDSGWWLTVGWVELMVDRDNGLGCWTDGWPWPSLSKTLLPLLYPHLSVLDWDGQKMSILKKMWLWPRQMRNCWSHWEILHWKLTETTR